MRTERTGVRRIPATPVSSLVVIGTDLDADQVRADIEGCPQPRISTTSSGSCASPGIFRPRHSCLTIDPAGSRRILFLAHLWFTCYKCDCCDQSCAIEGRRHRHRARCASSCPRCMIKTRFARSAHDYRRGFHRRGVLGGRDHPRRSRSPCRPAGRHHRVPRSGTPGQRRRSPARRAGARRSRRQKDCQTTGSTSVNGVPEHTVNWQITRLVKAGLESQGVKVVLSRPNDTGWGGCVDHAPQRRADPAPRWR